MQDKPRSQAKPGLERPLPAEIAGITPLTGDAKLIALTMAASERLEYRPGQFVQLTVGGVGELPLVICSAPGPQDHFEVTACGGGVISDALRRHRVGDVVGVRGPFGNGFDLEALAGRDLLLIGADDGAACLRPLLLAALADRERFGGLTLLLGARSPRERLFRFDSARLEATQNCRVIETVAEPDSEWRGRTGVVTALIPELEIDPGRTTAAVAGPAVMYKFVLLGLQAAGLDDRDILLALGHHMQCGRGECGHCRMYDTHVCLDGPIFPYSELRGKPGVF